MKKFVYIGTAITVIGIAGLSFQSEKELPSIEKDSIVKELPVRKNEAFKRGEVLEFRMHYGIIDAGVASLSVTEEAMQIGGRRTFHVVGLGKSKGRHTHRLTATLRAHVIHGECFVGVILECSNRPVARMRPHVQAQRSIR